jgi:AcrR family transcriptional regulator
LRRAAFRLFESQGYEATRTDEIAREAGVAPRTLFNYFKTKDALFFLPEQPLAAVLAASVASRPPGEDPVRSTAVAVMEMARLLQAVAGEERDLMLAGLQLMLHDPACRPFLERRRETAEKALWAALRRRGVPGEDLAARTAVAAIVAAGFLALEVWVERGGADPLVAILARCLSGFPDPVRVAEGVVGG